MRFDGYIRVSRVAGRGGESFISPRAQRDQITAWAKFRGVEILAWHEDLDRSGGTIDRPGFQRAIERIERGETEGLVVAKLDRFARSIQAAYQAIGRIDEVGGTFTSVADQFDLSTPSGKLTFNILASFAQFERDRIAESWREARARAIDRGVHLRTPFGYERGSGGALVPNEDARHVKEAFAMRAAGASWQEIAEYLNRGSRTTSGVRWSARTARTLLQTRTYTGVAWHGEFENRAAHEAIVSDAEFLAARRVRGVTPRRGEGALLAGLVRCAGCRYAAKRGKAKSRTGEIVRQYRCFGTTGGGKCPAPVSIVEWRVDELVERAFLNRVGDRAYGEVGEGDDRSLALQRVSEAEAELRAFASDPEARAVLGDPDWRRALRARAEAVERAKREVPNQAGGEMRELTLGELWADLTVAERRSLLAAEIDCVFLRRTPRRHTRAPVDGRVLILWRGEAPSDLPGRGRKPAPLKSLPWPERSEASPGAATLK